MIPLSEFKEGERGVIARVNGKGRFRKRLQEMGFIRCLLTGGRSSPDNDGKTGE